MSFDFESFVDGLSSSKVVHKPPNNASDIKLALKDLKETWKKEDATCDDIKKAARKLKGLFLPTLLDRGFTNLDAEMDKRKGVNSPGKGGRGRGGGRGSATGQTPGSSSSSSSTLTQGEMNTGLDRLEKFLQHTIEEFNLDVESQKPSQLSKLYELSTGLIDGLRAKIKPEDTKTITKPAQEKDIRQVMVALKDEVDHWDKYEENTDSYKTMKSNEGIGKELIEIGRKLRGIKGRMLRKHEERQKGLLETIQEIQSHMNKWSLSDENQDKSKSDQKGTNKAEGTNARTGHGDTTDISSQVDAILKDIKKRTCKQAEWQTAILGKITDIRNQMDLWISSDDGENRRQGKNAQGKKQTNKTGTTPPIDNKVKSTDAESTLRDIEKRTSEQGKRQTAILGKITDIRNQMDLWISSDDGENRRQGKNAQGKKQTNKTGTTPPIDAKVKSIDAESTLQDIEKRTSEQGKILENTKKELDDLQKEINSLPNLHKDQKLEAVDSSSEQFLPGRVYQLRKSLSEKKKEILEKEETRQSNLFEEVKSIMSEIDKWNLPEDDETMNPVKRVKGKGKTPTDNKPHLREEGSDLKNSEPEVATVLHTIKIRTVKQTERQSKILYEVNTLMSEMDKWSLHVPGDDEKLSPAKPAAHQGKKPTKPDTGLEGPDVKDNVSEVDTILHALNMRTVKQTERQSNLFDEVKSIMSEIDKWNLPEDDETTNPVKPVKGKGNTPADNKPEGSDVKSNEPEVATVLHTIKIRTVKQTARQSKLLEEAKAIMSETDKWDLPEDDEKTSPDIPVPQKGNKQTNNNPNTRQEGSDVKGNESENTKKELDDLQKEINSLPNLHKDQKLEAVDSSSEQFLPGRVYQLRKSLSEKKKEILEKEETRQSNLFEEVKSIMSEIDKWNLPEDDETMNPVKRVKGKGKTPTDNKPQLREEGSDLKNNEPEVATVLHTIKIRTVKQTERQSKILCEVNTLMSEMDKWSLHVPGDDEKLSPAKPAAHQGKKPTKPDTGLEGPDVKDNVSEVDTILHALKMRTVKQTERQSNLFDEVKSILSEIDKWNLPEDDETTNPVKPVKGKGKTPADNKPHLREEGSDVKRNEPEVATVLHTIKLRTVKQTARQSKLLEEAKAIMSETDKWDLPEDDEKTSPDIPVPQKGNKQTNNNPNTRQEGSDVKGNESEVGTIIHAIKLRTVKHTERFPDSFTKIDDVLKSLQDMFQRLTDSQFQPSKRNITEVTRIMTGELVKRGLTWTGVDYLNKTVDETKRQLGELIKEKDDLLKEKDDLATRLSRAVGAAVRENNPNIADLSDSNRPTKLAEVYSELYDNEWTEAFGVLEETDDDQTGIIGYLCGILKEAFDHCNNLSREQLTAMEIAILYPTKRTAATNEKELQDKKKIEFPAVIKTAIADIRKGSAGLSIDDVKRNVVIGQSKSRYDGNSKEVRTYAEGCLYLCWRMSLQTPPVVLDFNTKSGNTLDTNKYKLYTKSGKKVAYVVWPAMYLHKDGGLLCKGVAQGK